VVLLVPAEPEFASSAERDVWNAIKPSLGNDDAMLANLRITDGQGDHEGDIIVGMAGAGIAVIEVKGGRVEHNGTDWIQHGATSRRIAPVDQARKMKYALRTYLNSQDRWGKQKVRLAHLVAFPYSTIPQSFSLPDCPRSMILDKNDLVGDVSARIRAGVLAQDVNGAAPDHDTVIAMVESLSLAAPRSYVDESSTKSRRRSILVVVGALLLALLAIAAMIVAANRSDVGAAPAPAASGESLLLLNPASAEFDAAATQILCSDQPLNELDVSDKVDWQAMILQNELNKDYPRKVKVDGIYRIDTVEAVQWMQLANDITVSGYVGPNTWKHLRAIRCDGGPTPQPPDLSAVPKGETLITLDPKSPQFAADAKAILCSNIPMGQIARPMFKSWQTELVQYMLNTHHGSHLTVNGDFDKATESAVQLFQRDTQVEPTGIVGPESWQQLRNISC